MRMPQTKGQMFTSFILGDIYKVNFIKRNKQSRRLWDLRQEHSADS